MQGIQAFQSCTFRSLFHCLFLALAGFGTVFPCEAEDDPEIQMLQEVRVTAEEFTEGSAETGYRNSTGQFGPFGKTSLQAMPYSLNVTSGELFENNHAHTVSDALKTNPTASSLMESDGYSSMSRIMVRGFTAADQSDLRDGLVDRSFTVVPLENVERIEVLNGFSGFLHGFSALGGSVNYVSKQPTATPYFGLSAGQYKGGINYLHGDAGGTIPTDGRWGYRVNLYHENGATYIKDSRQKRSLLSGVLTFSLTPDIRFFVDIWHQEFEMKGLQSYINVNPGAGLPVPNADHFDATTQYGQDWTYNKGNKTLAGLGMESRFNDTFKFRAAYRYGTMWRDYLFVGANLTDNDGTYSEQATGSTRQHEKTRSAYALLDADFSTGPVNHKLTLGYNGTMFSYTRGDDVKAVLGFSHVRHPVEFANPNFMIGPTNYWTRSNYDSWLIGDRVQFNEKWSALAGFNWASLRQRSHGTGTALSQWNDTQRKLTPSYALMFKATPTVMTYVSYMEGLAAGGTAPDSARNAGETLAPGVSKQYELGLKTMMGNMDLNVALFRIDKINEYIDSADNVYKQDGRQVHQGLEFTTSGKLTARLTAIGGFTAFDAKVEKARNNIAIEGKTPVNVPRHQGRLYLEYALSGIPGLVLSGGANYFGKRFVDNMNNDSLKGATTFDVGARYLTSAASQKLTFNLNVSNLFDKAYWSYYRSGDGLFLGAPRVVSFSVKAEW
ncbi:MAG: TonB-dependent receptor [Azoarcus sp.]|jgi:iron complex outermembrane receptor protein|nr:TonB-dependent receptor [Azoarcus sp.]